jgi:hypothetical protein
MGITRPEPLPGIRDLEAGAGRGDTIPLQERQRRDAGQSETAHFLELAKTESGRKTLLQQQWGKHLAYRENNDNLFLVHFLEPSIIPGQNYDVTIHLVRHVWGGENQTTNFRDVHKAYFYFGPSWRDEKSKDGKVFEVPNEQKYIGVRIAAWGTFLATCLVVYTNDKSLILHRYIDFETGQRLGKAKI